MTIHIIANIYDKIDEDTLRNKGEELPHLKSCFTQIVAGRAALPKEAPHEEAPCTAVPYTKNT